MPPRPAVHAGTQEELSKPNPGLQAVHTVLLAHWLQPKAVQLLHTAPFFQVPAGHDATHDLPASRRRPGWQARHVVPLVQLMQSKGQFLHLVPSSQVPAGHDATQNPLFVSTRGGSQPRQPPFRVDAQIVHSAAHGLHSGKSASLYVR